MKILLVNAPARSKGHEAIVVPPLGLAYIAAAARQAGFPVSILDAFAEGLDVRAFTQRLAAGGPYDVIGFTAMTPVFDTVQGAIEAARPHARYTVLGGPHATAFRESVLKDNPSLDFAVYGEGEQTFVELLQALDKGSSTPAIAGLVARNGIGGARDPVKDLDAVPFPARELLPVRRYRYPLCRPGNMATMITSRGCPFPCIFCDKGVFGSSWRARSAENVLAEIDLLVRDFGTRTIVFYDDLFTLKADRLQQICEGLIARKYRLTWKAEGRVDIVDPAMLETMRRAGCDMIAYGVESGNQAGLDYLRKKTTPDMAVEAFARTRAAGIKTMGYFILGIPVETPEDALNTIRFAVRLNPDYAQFSVLSPLPGTPLYEEAVEKGWYREIPAQNVTDKDKLRPVAISGNWTEEQLVSVVRDAHRMFYMRPSYILKSLLRIRGPRELCRLGRIGVGMMKYLLGGLFRARRGS